MPKIAYVTKRFNRSSRELIDVARAICERYAEAGRDLTLRQLYYQMVAHHGLPNKQTEYKRLGAVLNDARLAGEIDWYHMIDRTRFLRSTTTWRDPEHIVNAVAYQYQTDRWADQEEYVEVWIEKDALVGVIQAPCDRWDTPYFACRGYPSQSEIWRAGRRLRGLEKDGKNTTVIHLGDHDPSGIDMTRDLESRLRMFGSSASVLRIALNMDQVDEYAPPPNPAKLTDSRADEYVAQYGDDSWELDALSPEVIEDLVEAEILARLDRDLWDAAVARDNDVRRVMREVASRWTEVVDFVNEGI